MESPVRILLCAVLVVNLLLLSSTVVSSHVLPSEATTTMVKTDRAPRFSRSNSTWPLRRPKNPDVALNELHPKDSVSEEHTEKNAKYKDRGRVRFHSQVKSSTESTFRRIRGSSSTTSSTTPQNPTEAAKIVIVTPTPEVKRPAQIIDSMRNYKKTKLPMGSSSTTPMTVSVKTESKSEETEEYTDEEEEENKDNFEKYTSSKFSDNFYTVPSFSDDFSQDSVGAYNKFKSEYSKPYSSFSSNFPEASYGPNTDDEPYKSESFFDFNSDLTTPRHSYFDSKYEQISKSIMQNLDTIKSKAPPKNATNIYKIVKENTGLEKLSNGTPNNKSTVIIRNTKEVRLLDNEKAGTSNKELSDVHGTSIYYEMSVLSTETYNIDHSDDDCDNDTSPEPTPSTSSEEELASLKATQSTSLPETTKPSVPKAELLSTVSSNYLSVSTIAPTFFNAVGTQPYSTQNTVSSTERSTRVFSSSFSRNRNYSKRLNLAGVKDSPNSVTSRTDQPALNLNFRVPTRKFHFTTPKSKPVWMAPRRNVTRTSYTKATTPSYSSPTTPSTIYSEHFSINNRTLSTPRPHHPSRTTLTTVSSEIDPVLQGEVSGAKKVVQSQSISDNSIPGLWKRGSTRYSSSTATSTETESGISDLEIPPTLAAWALASLRSPPGSGPINATRITHKTVDENELQKVADVADKKDTTTSSTSAATSTINNDIIPKKIVDIDQNRLPWRPVVHSTASSESVVETTSTENKSEGQLVESNLSAQNTAIKETTTEKHKMEMVKIDPTSDKSEENNKWISVTTQMDEVTATETTQVQETIPPVDATKSTGFESITKLPGGLTTPADDSAGIEQNINVVTQTPTTTDYDITTIRFSYVPTLPNTETEVETKSTTSAWHPVFPTRTKITTIQEGPITTYRPRYDTTTEQEEEVTTEVFETTVPTEVSSQIIATESIPITTATAEETTASITTEQPTTKLVTPKAIVESTTTPIETTTMIISVVTEINTERERPSSSSTEVSSSSTEVYSSTEITETPPSEIRETDSSSEENSGSNEVITQETSKVTQTATTPSTPETTFKISTTTEASTEELTESTITTTQQGTKFVSTIRHDTTPSEEIVESTTHVVGTEDTITTTDVTTEASSIVLQDEAGSGAAVAIAVSTIGVIALILLLGLLLVVRRRGRRGVYAQRCTPVSLDAYSLDSVSVGHRKGNHRLRASKRSYGNPAYDDEVTSHPMQYAALANFALDVESMSAEFAEIPSVTVRPDEVPPGCEDKNRYSNVLPLPETRVPLKRIDNDPRTEYINANFITGPGNIRNYYIACQAPLAHTVSDFWRMVWEQNSRVIVMLTEYMENGVEKCYEYLPPSEISDNKRTFGDYQIILMKREQRDKYAISSIQLINLVTRTWREVTQLWYFWPAKGVPDDYDSVIDFLSEMRSYMKISQTAKEYDEEGVEVIYGDQSRSSFHNLSKLRSDENGSSNGVNVYSPARAEEQMRREGRNNNGTLGRMKAASEVEGVRPCTVVCSSGAGRSAALIAADVCARALSAASADVPRVVRELRAQRPHSLSNRHHYIFLYKLLSEYGNKLMGGGVDTI